MKAKELIKILEQHPDFDVQVLVGPIKDTSNWASPSFWGNITGVADIGHSDKVIVLDNDIKVTGVLHYETTN